MSRPQRETAKYFFTVPELPSRFSRPGMRRRVSASNGEPPNPAEAWRENPAIDECAQDEAPIRILIVDNHPLFRQGIATILEKEPGMALVAQASTGQDAIQLYRQHEPDIMLMEIGLPDMGGIDALVAIRAEFPVARVIILTTRDGDFEVQRALAARASGYLLKDTTASDLLREIRRVHSGQKAIEPRLAARLVETMGVDILTPREIQVLLLAAEGNRNREIGERLYITEDTVKAHLRTLREKLGARDRTEAVAIAVRRGIIRL